MKPPPLSELRTLSEQVGVLLAQRGQTIALAESCTGGLIASILTDIAGSSAYVAGGAVTYSNEAKMAILGVNEGTLLAHGAVSAETAAEMAARARRLFGCDIAIAVTGIAGPGGGDELKPVGLVLFASGGRGCRLGRAARVAVRPHRQQTGIGGERRCSLCCAICNCKRI